MIWDLLHDGKYDNRDVARRVEASVSFNGINITDEIIKNLISIDYTDNEEDEADDLQIKLADREHIWIDKWLNEALQKAATMVKTTVYAEGTDNSGDVYQVSTAIGLNARSGPGTSYSRVGGLTCGTKVTVYSIENGWAKIKHDGKDAYVSTSYLSKIDEAADGETHEVSGLLIQALIIQRNWNSDGKDTVLDCGEFELDSVKLSDGPSEVTIKGTSIPYASKIRKIKKSKAWEAYHLSGIAKEMAKAAGIGCMYLSSNDPYYTRREQIKTSDVAFLSSLCKDAGISLKFTNGCMVLFDQAEYEKMASVTTIERGDGSYISNPSFSTGKADTQYQSCRVSYTDPATGKCISGIAYVEDYDEKKKENKQLEVTAKVASSDDAKALAAKRLRLHNKYEKAVSFTMVGDTRLVAGINVTLKGWGLFDGKYTIKSAKHSVGSSGYTTKIDLRPALEG